MRIRIRSYSDELLSPTSLASWQCQQWDPPTGVRPVGSATNVIKTVAMFVPDSAKVPAGISSTPYPCECSYTKSRNARSAFDVPVRNPGGAMATRDPRFASIAWACRMWV